MFQVFIITKAQVREDFYIQRLSMHISIYNLVSHLWTKGVSTVFTYPWRGVLDTILITDSLLVELWQKNFPDNLFSSKIDHFDTNEKLSKVALHTDKQTN
jgi:hypothetical protein